MNILKIQQDFLKGVCKEKGNTHKEYRIGKSRACVNVGYTDSHYMVLIPYEDNHIAFTNIPEFNPGSLIPKDLNGYQAALPKENLKVGKTNLTRLEVPGYYPTIYEHVDSKYLKYFDKDAIFYIKDRSSLIIVREDDAIVGIICPYIIKKVSE